MIQRVYIDTSVIGGCMDEEFDEWSNRLFDEFKTGKKLAVVSDLTFDELRDAPNKVQEILKTIPDQYIEVVIANKESRLLADLYLLEGAVSEKFYEDVLHIALATINQVSVLASWNFKHIVNLEKIRLYNSVT